MEKEFSKEKNQKYNYHTHTYRCGHAEDCDDEEYVINAVAEGFETLGFTDHAPKTAIELVEPTIRMSSMDVPNYLESMEKLKKKYNGIIEILSGFEAEFDPQKIDFLCQLRDHVDYMVLGQHFVPKSGLKCERIDPYYPLKYAACVCDGIKSGIFDVLVHPDHYMEFRDNFDSLKEKQIFEECAEKANEIICRTAAVYDIPLELNCGKIAVSKVMKDGYFPYPHPSFWKYAIKMQNKVIFGIDAHSPETLKELENYKQIIGNMIDISLLNILEQYNPVEARKNNPLLDEALKNSRDASLCTEAELAKSLVYSAISCDNIVTRDDILDAIEEELEVIKNIQQKKSNDRSSEIEKTLKTFSLSPREFVRLQNAKFCCDNPEEFNSFVELVGSATRNAYKEGCNSKIDFVYFVAQAVEQEKGRKDNIGLKDTSFSPIKIKAKKSTVSS